MSLTPNAGKYIYETVLVDTPQKVSHIIVVY